MWTFSLAFDSSTHQNRSYLDVRVRFGITGTINNFHLLRCKVQFVVLQGKEALLSEQHQLLRGLVVTFKMTSGMVVH
ncbi:hypothetical protein JG687_00015165 [Phytophthora cactorum]|uniref:Uncharacterized protein n=1 Tax=Phytophthora cactorum TaxID=29920 RepID=A0A8T1TXI3_9STRA|nr:hypothetical protein GQ600_27306 [Phytophthora cactorum]KAG6948941.1 hypothetical protein JG687_00015165 [Phytophthora cactorum]